MVHPFQYLLFVTSLKRGANKIARYSGLKSLQLILVIGLLTLFLSACQSKLSLQPASAQTRSGPTATETGDRSPLKLPLIRPMIVVKKSRRQLLLFSEDKVVRTYSIGLGLSPIGDKVRQGDRRTPEGDFYIFTRNDKSAFYLSLGISYPNAAAAERGLRDHLINKTQYDAIMRALRAKKGPPQNTLLGGDIYIHGNGAGSDWTWGCVALENEDIRELFDAVSVGTPVIIQP
jgi:murein L,D-transpeptidase YafK